MAKRTIIDDLIQAGKVSQDIIDLIIAERDAKNRERRIEDNRREIRNKVFAGQRYSKAQQVSFLYDYLADNVDSVKSWLVRHKFKPTSEEPSGEGDNGAV